MQPGQTSVVERISDADPEMLRFVESIGIAVGSPVRLVDRHDYAGLLVVETSTGTSEHLGTVVAQAIWVALPDRD
jgi:DtxR family Mn-dependent transcriptional regulator